VIPACFTYPTFIYFLFSDKRKNIHDDDVLLKRAITHIIPFQFSNVVDGVILVSTVKQIASVAKQGIGKVFCVPAALFCYACTTGMADGRLFAKLWFFKAGILSGLAMCRTCVYGVGWRV
jgi:hypothetical protein